MAAKKDQITGIVDDINKLLEIFPEKLKNTLKASPNLNKLTEVVLDLGFPPEVRFQHSSRRLMALGEMSIEDIQAVSRKVEPFNTDNRAGLERTLHRVSAIRNREGKIIGLTCRIGKAVFGTIEIIRDIIESGRNCLFLGPPGIGKTTILRETARVLADQCHKRVVIVDTSNEIAGDGDIPHPAIGFARRMQVPSPDKQHAVMIEAVENHMPEVIVVDEIGTEQEAAAARTIAERGVQLVATAHGYHLHNLINNPMLSDLVGGVQNVVLGDEEAKFRGTKKTVLERKSPPTFDVVIEVRSRDVFAIYNPVASSVDAILRDDPIDPEMRSRDIDNVITEQKEKEKKEQIAELENTSNYLMVFPYGINTDNVASVVHSLEVPVRISPTIGEADIVLTVKSKVKGKSKVASLAQSHQLPLHVLNDSDTPSVAKFFKRWFRLADSDEEQEQEALREVERACQQVINESRIIELSPRPTYQRRLQHRHAFDMGLNSMSVGEDPNRRVRIYPRS